MYLHNNFSGRSFPYFIKTHGTEAENLRVLRDLIPLMKKKYNLDIKTIQSDNELNQKKTRNWLRLQGINLELSAPRTQAQNGYAERCYGHDDQARCRDATGICPRGCTIRRLRREVEIRCAR